MKVLVLFCGGTIIMKEDSHGALLVTEKDEAIDMIVKLEPRLSELTDFDVHYVDNIDSTNMNPGHWDQIGAVIHEKYNDYDGFVITHGTDTMAFTASALTWSLSGLGKPVVLTGSQIPGNRIETDARRNFVNAMRVATMGYCGVMVVFGEKIILGARSSKISESKLDAFETINAEFLGDIRSDIRFSTSASTRHDGKLNFTQGFEAEISVFTLFPGLPVSRIDSAINSGTKGIILKGYGPGNIPYSYSDALKKAKQKNIPVVVRTQCYDGATQMHMYDVGKQALDAGVIQAYDMSFECIMTKFMWSLKHATSYEDIKEIMHTNYVGELNKEGRMR